MCDDVNLSGPADAKKHSLMQAPVQPVQRSYAPVTNTKDNPPCNTLFIGNLSEHTSEDELRGIFQGQPGA